MKIHLKIYALFILLTFTFSCDSANDEEIIPEAEVVDVYALVTEYDGANFNVKVWKNDVATPLNLTNTTSVTTETMYVSESDVYVGGSEYNGSKHVAKIWKNGVSTSLTDGSNNSGVSSVFVSGNDVYAGGYEKTNGIHDIAKIWKNGIAISLSGNRSRVNSIFVDNNDVYAVGYEEINSDRIATLWKNGVATSFDEDDKFISINSVSVSNGNVYVIGEEYIPGLSIEPDLHFVRVWLNGVKTTLDASSLSEPESMFVLGEDTYVAGSDYLDGTEITIAQFWKNGIKTTLTNGVNRAKGLSVFATNLDVYVGGYEHNGVKDVAKIWKNGAPTSLSDGTNSARVTAVFVTEN